jgi:hypothetical protein
MALGCKKVLAVGRSLIIGRKAEELHADVGRSRSVVVEV